ncbi:MAG: HPr family phosphocarrier protein [Pseudomonadales bacterium]|nr:HPr family phosphocarrier protein [Pseudomonadales bacterium]
MKRLSLTLINGRGLHARAATKLVALAKAYQCTTQLSFDGKEADGKSVMSLLMLAAGPGSQITLITSGHDEDSALVAIQALIDNKFEEEE